MNSRSDSRYQAGGPMDDVAQNIRNDRQAGAIDRNPLIDCERCGESYSWQDEWESKIDSPESLFWCDSCWAALIETARQERRIQRAKHEHNQLTEYVNE